MSPRRHAPTTAQHHVEWLQLVDISGPFISLGVLSEVFPQNLDAIEPELADRYRQAFAEWQANRDLRRPDAAIDTAFVDFVLRDVLEYPDEFIADRQELGDRYSTELPEHRVTLRADAAVRRPGERPALLLARYGAGVALDKPLEERGLHASPAERMRMLLARTDARTGLVTNGGEWLLVHAPPERTATFATWYSNLLNEERITLRAFRSLLGTHRLFGVEEESTLEGMFERSRDDEREVTDQLGVQARRAVELLVSAFDRADRDAGGALLARVPEFRLYEATLAVVMRIIFLLAAEARGLFPDDGPWAESYAITPLRAQLQEAADRQGIEVLERRFDAWARLVATFRAVHDGVEHSRVRMPGYGGGLFDPRRYPFLEGEDSIPRISNRAVLHILDALQTLEAEVPGGRERRPLSFRALGVEQIGNVYERLLDHTAVRADAPAVGLVGTQAKEPEIALSVLERTRDRGETDLLEFLVEETGRSKSALRRALTDEEDPERIGRLRAACGHDESLITRVLPFLALLRDDVFGDPLVFQERCVYVTASPMRRATGTHYTPPSLTESIVQYALEPIVYAGPAEGLPREQWTLRKPPELLNLKVCDIAMGSAAFLVAACRYLATRIVEGWELHPDELPPDAGEDREERHLTARRLVAERCLYGVDANSLAVEIAKVAMWLITMRKDRPFTFLDHAFRHGDSLLGLTNPDQLEWLTLTPRAADSILLEEAREAIRSTLGEVRTARDKIEASDALDLRDVEEKAAILKLAENQATALRVVGDLVVGAALSDAAGACAADVTVEAAAGDVCHALLAGSELERDARLGPIASRASDALLSGRAEGDPNPPKTFHWILEFPEVLDRDNPGFDAIIGNPPFLGGKKVSGVFGGAYREYLVQHVAGNRRGTADLVAYFFLRAVLLMREEGTFGLLATNTVAQGDTREVALGAMDSVTIHRAWKSRRWPGEAALYVSHVWGRTGGWRGPIELDGQRVRGIAASLSPSSRVTGDAHELAENALKSHYGVLVNGAGFLLQPEEATGLLEADPRNAEVLFPYVIANDLTSRSDQSASRWAINFHDWPLERAKEYALPYRIVEERVKPSRLQNKGSYKRYWWQFGRRQEVMQDAIAGFERVLVGPQTAKYWFVVWLPPGWIYSHATTVFALEKDGHAAVLSSSFHDAWARKYSGSLKFDLRYSPTDCFHNFPFPPDVNQLNEVGARYLDFRREALLEENVGLTQLYNSVNEDPADVSPRVEGLRALRRGLDQAVIAAYGWDDLSLDHDFREIDYGEKAVLRYTISEAVRIEVLDRLLELNHERYAAQRHLSPRRVSAAEVGDRRNQATAPAAARLFDDE